MFRGLEIDSCRRSAAKCLLIGLVVLMAGCSSTGGTKSFNPPWKKGPPAEPASRRSSDSIDPAGGSDPFLPSIKGKDRKLPPPKL